jgi:hypothetical protein
MSLVLARICRRELSLQCQLIGVELPSGVVAGLAAHDPDCVKTLRWT